MFGEDLQIRDFMYIKGVGAAADKTDADARAAESMSVTFRNSSGTDVQWTEWRSPGLNRANTVNFCFTDKSEICEMPKVANSVPLFLGDLEIFLQKVRETHKSSKSTFAQSVYRLGGKETDENTEMPSCGA